MPQPASSSSFAYDVFLSFRGSDTRYDFTGNLYQALSRKGIRTFIDDEELQEGEEITQALLDAIEESRIAIIVFSENYAFSTFCLKELVMILKCAKQKGRWVLPVFYKVDPSDLRHIKGSYGQAMAKHEARSKNDIKKINEWKLALQEAANLSGSHFQPGIEYEHKFIERIVEKISRRTSPINFPIADYPIGLESRVQEVKSLLNVESNEEVIMVGIYGTGGIGKSTIARAIYNVIADQFEGVCFLDDVRDNSIKKGLAKLQKTMLSEIIGEKNIKFTDVYKGISIIKNRLSRKKILLILDNVNELDQLKKLVGGLDWFGPGSRIIITTRDMHLLQIHGVQRKYEVETLSHKEAHELFIWNAFKCEEFDPNYMEVLESLVLYCSGIPLALEVVGCHLFGRSLDQWKSALYAYENVPKKTIEQILKVSYDDLGNDEKEIFLDIACFFKGRTLKYVENVLSNGRGIPPQAGIGVLKDRCLIKIDSSGPVWMHDTVRMHDLIENIGKEIVRKESSLEPGKRRRLWFYEDILHVFEENTGTDKIEAIVFHSNEDTMVDWNGNAFEKMKNLQILIIKNVSFSMGPKYLPNSLKYLDWEQYSSSTLPFDFNPRKLAVLNLVGNRLTSFTSRWNLKFLSQINLRGSRFLHQVPDLSGVSNLRELILNKCTNLIEVHSSVGALDKLCHLSALGCTRLKIFPEAMKSTSLRCLNFSGCPSLGSVPLMPGIPTEKIRRISLGNSIWCDHSCDHSWENFQLDFGPFKLPKVEKIMEGLGHLRKCRIQDNESVSSSTSSNMRVLRIHGFNLFKSEVLDFFNNYSTHEGLSSLITCFPNLEELDLSSHFNGEGILAWHPSLPNLRNNFMDEFVFKWLHWMPKLQELRLWSMDFTVLPQCINECHFLRILTLDYCEQLQEIRGMPPNIEYLSAKGCTSLSVQSQSILLSQILHKAGTKRFFLPGTKIPGWFDYRQSTSRSLSFWVRNKFPERIILGFVLTRDVQYYLLVDGIRCGEIRTDMHLHLKRPHILLFHVPMGVEELKGDGWTLVEFSSDNSDTKDDDSDDSSILEGTNVSCMGVHVYSKGKNSREDIRFTNLNPEKSKVDEDMGNINSHYHPLLKNWGSLPDKNFCDLRFPWFMGKICEIQALEKVKILIWEIATDCLPTCMYLFRRRLIKSPLCPICETEYETIQHAFLDCPWTRAVWFGSDLQWIFYIGWNGSFPLWFYKKPSDVCHQAGIYEGQHLNKMKGIVGNVCWAIWKGRNEYIFEDKPVDPALVFLRVRTLYNQYQAHNYPLVQKIYGSTDEITNQGQVNGSENKDKGKSVMMGSCDTNSELWSDHTECWDSMITDSISDSINDKEKAGESSDNGDKGKGKCVSTGNNNDEAETRKGKGESDDKGSMMMDSTIHNKEVRDSENEVKGKNIAVECNGNTEVNERHVRCSWLVEFAIQLLRCLPLPKHD